MRTSKRLPITLVAIFYLLLSSFNTSAQSVGINDAGAAPEPSALLDLNSTNKGFLITRADTANISSPAFGLMTLAPIDSCLYIFDGTFWTGMGGGGSDCSCNCKEPAASTPPEFPCGGTVIPVIDITSPSGRIWMDRNLGADQVATSSADAASYGDLYQWGRCSDGHEKRTSNTTYIRSNSDTPGHGNFILGPSPPNSDWRNPKNDNLWQGLNGINNPCPTGYRIPTEAEWIEEYGTWSSNNSAGGFASLLKIPASGFRRLNDGSFGLVGSLGYYWTSSFPATGGAKALAMSNSTASIQPYNRAAAMAIRCIKD